MKCNYCGYEFNGKFCPNCGAAAPVDDSSTQLSAPQQPNYNSNEPKYQSNAYYSDVNSGIEVRSIVTCIILYFVTCGIYGIIWFIKLTDDTNKAAQDSNGTPGGTAFLLTLITCGIYGWYWSYKQGEKIDRARQMRGLQTSNYAVIFLVLNVIGLGIVSYCLMQNELNNMA